MADYIQPMSFQSFYSQEFGVFPNATMTSGDESVKMTGGNMQPSVDTSTTPKQTDPPPPPPVVICPTEVESVNITLEKNQQCACKDCGKLFNSVWYLKQHAVKHSNDRPFKCKFCFKTYKFRSNLYQHKCPDRQRSGGGQGRRMMRGSVMLSPSSRRIETNQILKSKIEANMNQEEQNPSTNGYTSDNEENDAPIQYGLNIRVEQPDVWQPPEPVNVLVSPPTPPRDCIREQQLSQDEIDQYIGQHKSDLHTCRKCRLLFPSAETLMRHCAMHSHEEMFCYSCTNCRESFTTEKELKSHSLVHSNLGPWRCQECCGTFRSNMALRRHRDQCLECVYYPFGVEPEMMVSPSCPLDPFSFIVSSQDNLIVPTSEDLARGPDSGLGSESSPHSFHASPDRALPSEEELEEALFGKKKPPKDDDEDSGFRSRLNSVTQSCSPGSSSQQSSEHGSPLRKMSAGHENLDIGFTDIGTGYGSGPAYGTMMSHHFEQSVGASAGTLSFSGVSPSSYSLGLDGTPISVQSQNESPSGDVLIESPLKYHHGVPSVSKEMFIEPCFDNLSTDCSFSSEATEMPSGGPFKEEDPLSPLTSLTEDYQLAKVLQATCVSAVLQTTLCVFHVSLAISLLTAASLTKNDRTE